jgi:nucleotide-binding universal stress UspA family protein
LRGKEKSENEPIRLILGADGSPDSSAMIDEVAARNWRRGTELILITAIESFSRNAAELDVYLNRVRDLQTLAANRLTAAGIGVSTMITEEDPKHFLARQAELWNADCIFLGARGHSFLDRLLVGSVSSSVAARAGCSVEVVRRKSV